MTWHAKTNEEPADQPAASGGRRTGLVRLALGLLVCGALLACVPLSSGQPPMAVLGLPLGLLLVLVALIIAAFVWRQPGAKLTIVLCGLTLLASAAVARYGTISSSDVEPLDNSQLPPQIQKLIPLHTPLGKPLPGDWLTNHFEVGQTYRQYVGDAPVRPDERRRVICIQPLGDFTATQRKIVRLTAEFMGLYFQLPVRVGDDLPLSLVPESARRKSSYSGGPQLLTGFILEQVLKPRMPEDAVVMIAFTASDLWPGEGWNFVYGWASPTDRVGVWSICRYGNPEESDEAFRPVLRRAMKIATHETAHMFSMQHCIFYECCMCGVNHLEETDRHPPWLCPQCLAKLCYATNADPAKRFQEMQAFAETHGLDREAAFWQRSLAALREE